MDTDNERIQPGETGKKSRSRWRLIWRIVLALVAAGLGYIGGLISGSGYGGNYAPDFSFFGMPGYEGSGMMAGVASGGSILLVASLSLVFLRNSGTAVFVVVGAFVGILFGAPLFFPVIAPSTGLLALTYAGSAGVGALVGAGIGALTFRRRRTD